MFLFMGGAPVWERLQMACRKAGNTLSAYLFNLLQALLRKRSWQAYSYPSV